jgi:hypothetical protein
MKHHSTAGHRLRCLDGNASEHCCLCSRRIIRGSVGAGDIAAKAHPADFHA